MYWKCIEAFRNVQCVQLEMQNTAMQDNISNSNSSSSKTGIPGEKALQQKYHSFCSYTLAEKTCKQTAKFTVSRSFNVGLSAFSAPRLTPILYPPPPLRASNSLLKTPQLLQKITVCVKCRQTKYHSGNNRGLQICLARHRLGSDVYIGICKSLLFGYNFETVFTCFGAGYPLQMKGLPCQRSVVAPRRERSPRLYFRRDSLWVSINGGATDSARDSSSEFLISTPLQSTQAQYVINFQVCRFFYGTFKMRYTYF